MKKETFHKAFNDKLSLLYKPKNTLYLLFSFAEIVDEHGNKTTGICYQSEDRMLYVRPLSDFEKFDLVKEKVSFEKIKQSDRRELKSSNFNFPHEYLSHVKIKQSDASWKDGVLYACSMGMAYCCTKDVLGHYTISAPDKESPKVNRYDHYEELKKESFLTLWDGDLSRIPEKDTLVSFNTASSGDVNGVVTGYKITWYENKPQIRISLRHPNSDTTNQRFLNELGLPLSVREKSLQKEILALKQKLQNINET
jgi:hypothetical protein